MVTRTKPTMLVVNGVLAVLTTTAGVGLIYVCHTLAKGTVVVLDILSRSL